jgi:carboxylesterase
MGVTHDLLERVACPTLVFQSRDDHVVKPGNAEFIMAHLGTEEKRLIWLENSYHVATLDNDKELIAEETTAFIKAHA